MLLRLLLLTAFLILPAIATKAADEADFARHLSGCWQHGQIPPAGNKPQKTFMSQVCFEDTVESMATYFTCDGFGSFDCWDDMRAYKIAEQKLRLSSDDPNDEVSCDAQIVPKKQLSLTNCIGSGAVFT